MDTRRYLIALAMTTVLGAPVVAFSDTPGHGGSHPTGFGAKTGKLPPGGGSLGVIEELALMQAVWGQNFDPAQH
jgi:hypothetical protein